MDSDLEIDLDLDDDDDLQTTSDRLRQRPSDLRHERRRSGEQTVLQSPSAAVVAGASTTRLAVRHIRHRDQRLIRHSHRQRSAHGQDLRRVDRVLDRRADRQRKRVADAAPARCRASTAGACGRSRSGGRGVTRVLNNFLPEIPSPPATRNADASFSEAACTHEIACNQSQSHSRKPCRENAFSTRRGR